MTGLRERYVRERFDALEPRFKRSVAADDFRVRAVLRAIGPIDGRRVLDLGCGKGRFASHLAAEGARVVGLDPSSAMLAHANLSRRVKAGARRLPFASASFDAVVAVEVFEHLTDVTDAIREASRVLRPGGRLVVVDKNAGSWNVRRPWLPNLVVKWVDERRGLWMYPPGAPVRERWFRAGELRRLLSGEFEDVQVERLLAPDEARRAVFRLVPAMRMFLLWSARKPESPR